MKEYQLGTAHLRALKPITQLFRDDPYPPGSIFVVHDLSYNGHGTLVGCMARYPNSPDNRFFNIKAHDIVWEFA